MPASRDGVPAGQAGQAGLMSPGATLTQRLTLAAACIAQVMMVLDVMIVSVALPALQHELHLSPAGLEWVVSAYALALATLIPTGGALGDHFGRKRVFMTGLALFTLASAGNRRCRDVLADPCADRRGLPG